MTIPATTRKAGPFTGNGSTTAFPFTFKVFTTADIAVIKADVDGIESALTLDSDYSVTLNSDQDATPGGTVTYPISGSPLPSTDKLSIKGDVDYEQGTDIPTGGDFNPVVLENALDSLSMQIQQVQEAVSRAAVVPITSATDAADLVADIALLASKIDNLDTIFANMADITTVADDLNEAVSEIETVAGAITNVNNVGNNITNVNTVAGISANVTTVAGISANVTTVAGISAAVSGVAAISAAVSAVNSNATNINAVNSNATNINAVAANETNIDAVAANETNIDAVVANETNIDAVAANATNINAVADNETNIDAVAANEANIDTVAGINANVTTVAGISSAVSAVAADAADIGTVATNIANVNSVATNIADVNTAATNMAAILDAPTQAAAAAASAASAAASLDNFDDRYLGSKSSAPTVDNDGNALVAGALYFNNGTIVSDDKGMWVYDGGTWIAASAASQAILVRYKYVATAAQTTFTGADANGLTLSYTAGSIIVTLNGVVMDAADYTATNGNSVVLGSGAAASDEVCVFAFSTFDIANTYTQAQADAEFLRKAGEDGVTVSSGNIEVTGKVTAAKGSNNGITIGDVSTNSNSVLRMQGTSAGKNWQIANNLNVAGLEFTPSTVDGGTTYTTPAATMLSNGNFQFNSGYGSVATTYGCRAWVNFNGTGTVAIRGSGNVSSITDNGTGNYAVNFTTAMPDANYSQSGIFGNGSTKDWSVFMLTGAVTSTSLQIFITNSAGVGADFSVIGVSIFR